MAQPDRRKLLIGFPGLGKPEGSKIFLSRLKESIRKQGLARTTHFINPLHDVSIFGSVARSFYAKPYVLRLDGIYIDARETCGKNNELNAPIKRAIEGAKALVFQSNYSKRTIEHHFGRANIPSSVIPNGASMQVFGAPGESMRAQLGIPKGQVVILTSGSWRAHKRLGAVIALFFALRHRYKDVHLIVVGPHSDTFPDHECIHFTGYVPPSELPKWYRSADIFVFLSWLDSCPNSVTEAIVSGLPVLCTNLGGTRELVERANAGIVVEADKPFGPGLVDLYHPPEPNMDALLGAAETLLANLPRYRTALRRDALDVDRVAREYVTVASRCVGPGGC